MPTTVSENPELADLFHSLTPAAQAAALVYGVVNPHVCTAAQTVRMLDHTLDRGDIGSRRRRLDAGELLGLLRQPLH